MFKRERLGAHMQRNIASELQKQFPGQYISVTEVKVAEGSRHAVVWISILDDSVKEEIFARIQAMKGRLRSSAARGVKLRRVPEIDLKLDERMQRAQDIGRLT